MRSVNGIYISFQSSKIHISNEKHCFYFSTIRYLFCTVGKHSTDLSQHEALHDAHVHQTVLRVASDALRFEANVRVWTRCSKYVMIQLPSGTRVLQTTLRVAFGVCHRVIPARHLGQLFG